MELEKIHFNYIEYLHDIIKYYFRSTINKIRNNIYPLNHYCKLILTSEAFSDVLEQYMFFVLFLP